VIIAISGKAGSGKSSVGERVAQILGLRIVSHSFKTLAEKTGKDLMEVQKEAASNPAIDKDMDEIIRAEAAKGDCVVVTWLGPWIVRHPDLRVWLDATDETRAARIAGRDGMDEKGALEHIKKRDSDNRQRYLKLYGIDIEDRSEFDLELNSGKFSIEQLAQMIANAARVKGGELKR